MNFMDQTKAMWCERTQDMSGFVPISPLLDEETTFTFSSAQYENCFDVQNLENPSPEEFILGDQTEATVGEDSIMFENNYSTLDTKMEAWLPNIPNSELSEFTYDNSFLEDNTDFHLCIDSENLPIFSEVPKVNKTPSTTVNRKPGYFSIFDSEEPHIEENLESPSSCCTDDKPVYDIKDDMEIAEEVEVTTEDNGYIEISQSSLFLIPGPPNIPSEEKEEEVTIKSESSEKLTDSLTMDTPFKFDYQLDNDPCDTWFKSIDDSQSESLICRTPEPKSSLPLKLDISLALPSSQLLPESLPGTPDVLKTIFKPDESEFDLVTFLDYLANNDSNNNAVLPSPTPLCPHISKTSVPVVASENSRNTQSKSQTTKLKGGKSRLSLSELEERSQNHKTEQSEPEPGPSRADTSVRRPARKSAAKFKKMIEEGFFNTTDTNFSTSDDEDSAPKTKRRRTNSSSSMSRKRLTSDSDVSGICDNALKYRERRDRNNLSSKKSRQKRKFQQEVLKQEQKQLEARNKKLKKQVEVLAQALAIVHAACKDYFSKMKEEK